MIPLALFLLGCTTAYVGAVQVAFAALMRLPLRLNAERAERRGRAEGLGHYLDDPVRLFMPARILQAATVSLVTLLVMVEYGSRRPQTLGLVLGAMLAYIVICGQVIPLLVARRDPERALELLLPAFEVVARGLTPVTRPLLGLLEGARRERSEVGASTPATDGAPAGGSNGDQRSELDEHEERELLRSVVEFGDTLVHEVMTPRPDIVAVKSTSTLAELRATFVEQQYSRIPVYRESLDEILGFVFVKDLVGLDGASSDQRVVDQLMRPAYLVPETKRVADLLKEFQQQQVQSAIVHDEYGGTAGLVTIEDLLEEIVGEIRDEYDVESEPIVDEGEGSFVFAGTVGVDDLSECLNLEIERQGFETVGGYVLSRFGRVPRAGESMDIDGVNVEVLEAEQRRVRRVRIRRRLDVLEESE